MRTRLVVGSLLCLTLVGACGNDSSSSSSSNSSAPAGAQDPTIPSDCPPVPADTVPAVSFPAGKPAVHVPATSPTTLVVTDLLEGSGRAAADGDTVTVNYVGVRSADGTEFDNSYDRGQTFPVVLGQGSVIAGWDQGLIGIKPGGRRQLDIPAELAYGDSPQGDVIKPGDALTFVVDAVSVAAGPPVADPADAPHVDVPKSVGATKVTVTDLVNGDRCRIALRGQTADVQVILYRGDTAALVQSSWTDGHALELRLDDTTVPGLVDGIIGMGVGGRRMLVLPPAQGFGPDLNGRLGLGADTDVVVVVDLVALTA